MGRIANLVHCLKPPLLMVVVQLIAGINVMYKLAANDGMSLRLIVVYRFLFAYAIMVPLALIFERKSLEKINRKIVFQSFLCGLFGSNLYLQSLVYTSATFVAAMINLAPASGSDFVSGDKLCVAIHKGGIFYGDGETGNKNKSRAGKSVWDINRNRWSNVVHILQRIWSSWARKVLNPRLEGKISFFLPFYYTNFIILVFQFHQAKMSVKFPYLYSSTALMCVTGGMQGAVIALCTVSDWSQWRLGWNVRLLAVAYVGILGSALLVFLVSWAVRLIGPLYASIFNPLGLVFFAVLGSLLLDEELYIIGGLMIVCGVYVVLWGKAKEMKQKTQLVPVPTVDSHEATEEDKQSEIKETDEEDIEAPHAIVLA
ncbi:Mtn21-like protein, putative isoform 2 [Hibiscus syriacus]|uniref:WAT1-related protein n=1 Tax=Hibiscus syriacus TaxID=106335 RepID=A0A6A2XCG7_HIBSY|nr:Mtn21-like protein, putative isoform 2 [Hibiscus syriacus]